MNTIKITATKRTNHCWKDEEYNIEISIFFKNTLKSRLSVIDKRTEIFLMNKKNGEYVEIIKKPYGNNTETLITSYINKGYFTLSDKEYYTKSELLQHIERFNKCVCISIEFDENQWTESKTWKIDLSNQITVRVKDKVFTTIDNTPPKYPVDYGYVDYGGKVCENVVQLVHTLFCQIGILGAEVKVDGKTLSYIEALNTKPRNIKLIEIFL